MTDAPRSGWERKIESGGMSVEVGPDSVSLLGPGGTENLTDVQVERLYQALTGYREHSNLNWRWASAGSDWWK